MVIISKYSLIRKDDSVFAVVSAASAPPCPYCGGILTYRDSRKRICKKEGGKKNHFIVRRLRCTDCSILHTELPDRLVPYKHYEAEVVSGVLDDIITADDAESEDYPCTDTMKHWKFWLFLNQEAMEEAVLNVMLTSMADNYKSTFTVSDEPMLVFFRRSFQNWLECLLTVIYNSGKFVIA